MAIPISRIETLGKPERVNDLHTYLLAQITSLVELKVNNYIQKELPRLLDEALDRQRKTVADELVRILLAKQL